MAYDIQDTISLRSRVPFRSPWFADSVFRKQLLETGFPDRADIRWIRYPSRELILYTGSPTVDFGDITTRLFPLDKDSTSCIFAVVRSPQRTIMSTTWYMQVPLLIAFLFVSLCVFFLADTYVAGNVGWNGFEGLTCTSLIHDMKSPLQSVMMGAHIWQVVSWRINTTIYVLQASDGRVRTSACNTCNRVIMLTEIDREIGTT